ncbi:MAG TPA: cation:proton antiporter [Vicinamibacterales bacterium]|jgi:CPA1 family monovalent cation:H+ antiporter|nr:cation:proton antiporter [Vicinamibacterales bacterium]
MSMNLPAILLLLAGLLILVSFVQRLAARWTLPASILFAMMGAVIGGGATLVLHSGTGGVFGELAHAFVDLPITADTFMYVFVPALLFQSSLSVDIRGVFEDAAPIFLLAVVAVLLATAVIGVALIPFAGVPVVACLLLASIVATTDSVAVISIFRDVGAPARLCRLVEGESLLNDAAAIVAFTVLLGMLLGQQDTSVASAAIAFVWTFIGGIAFGYLGTRLVVWVLPWLQDLRLAQVTLTLVLPYLVYIIGERALGVSGVIAAVTSGLVMGAIGPPRIPPSDWRFLVELWEQLAYWASSLIFVLAALLIPKLLFDANLHFDVSAHDALVLLVMLLAAFAARALILFGFFPLMTAAHLGQRVGHRFNVVILWGGLRGAVTLALALAITENDAVPAEVKRFIGVQATGFVLFSLLVPGLTLRSVIRWLGLDRLSAFDQTLRSQVLTLSRGRVADTVERIGRQYRVNDELIARTTRAYRSEPAATPAAALAPPSAALVASDEEQLRLGLVALTQREREIVLEHFDARTVSGETVEDLLGSLDRLLDRARTRGASAYLDAGQAIVGFSRSFRFAHLLHRRFSIDGPVVDRLADRFERLSVSRIVLEELAPYVDETLARLVTPAIAARLRELVSTRQAMTTAALEAMGAQYPEYAALLEERFLRRLALRREDLEYRSLFDEHVIGPELFGVLQREIQETRAAVLERPRLDLGLETRALIARVPMFAALDRDQLDALSRLLRPQLAVPDERLIKIGAPGDAMYFIASGVLEVMAAGQRILLSRGDFVGEMALVLNQPRQADVTALSYCLLLTLDRRDFQSLLRGNAQLREIIDREATARARMNEGARADGVLR